MSWNFEIQPKTLQKVDAELAVNSLCFRKYFNLGRVFVYIDY